MEIKAQIVEGIRYKTILESVLQEIPFDKFDVNSSKSSCLVTIGQNRFAISKWVSPKRTRSYPYERVYNTFSVAKRLTIIPILKDEGAGGRQRFFTMGHDFLNEFVGCICDFGFLRFGGKTPHTSRENYKSKIR